MAWAWAAPPGARAVPPGAPRDAAAADLADQLRRGLGEEPDRTACRARTCRRALTKLGVSVDAPLVVEDSGPEGWILIGGGRHRAYSIVVDTGQGPVAVAVAVAGVGAA